MKDKLIKLSHLLIPVFIFLLVVNGTHGQTLIHNFEFNSNLNDTKATGASLTPYNTASSSFETNPNGWTWTQPNSPGGGLIMLTDALSDPQSYSVGFRIEFDNTGNPDGSTKSYKKILSFKGQSDDNGLYFNHQNLQFFPFGANADITYVPDTFYDFVLTRSSADVITVYIVQENGTVTKVYEENDNQDASVPHAPAGAGTYEFRFFMNDDVATEHTPGGTVRSIRLWDGPLSQSAIAGALSSVTTLDATDIATNSATLNGEVNPQGTSSTFAFEYGTTTSYGNLITASPSGGSGSSSVPVQASLSGLEPGITYHYRLKSTNINGDAFGDDKTFTTQSAGGVAGPNLWLKADAGVTPTNGTLTGWADEAGINNFIVSGDPQVNENNLNFNPAIEFDGTGDWLTGSNSITFQTLYVVSKLATASGQPTLLSSTLNDSGNPLNQGYFAKGNNLRTGNNNGAYFQSNGSLGTEKARLSIVQINPGENSSNQSTYIDGKAFSTSVLATNGNFNPFEAIPYVGRSADNTAPDYYNGDIGELIMYPTVHSENERNRVLSYLAVKYGITLDPSVGQYLSSNGTAVWNFTGYWNDVFGIGKDDASSLNQTQSNSINTGSGNGIGQPGKGNLVLSAASLDDGDFMMIGHDNGALNPVRTALNQFPDFGGILPRKWKVKSTGSPGNVQLKMDLHEINVSGNLASDFKLLIDTDGDGNLNTGTINDVTPANFTNRVLQFDNLDLPDGAVFQLVEKVPDLTTVSGSGDLRPNRIIVNPSFETGSIVPHDGVSYPESQVGDNPQIDGWYSTHPEYQGAEGAIEHWKTGFNGVPARDGDYFVELNVSQSSRLYQFVYLVNGENVDWSYSHRGRINTSETVVYAVYAPDGSRMLKELNRHQVTSTSSWDDVSGTFTWDQPTGIYQIGFESTTSGGSGNFLDNVNIELPAFVEFAKDTIRLSEGEQIAPFFYVNGEVQQASSFTVSVQSGTAAEGTDYTFASKTKPISVGNYALADSLALDFQIIDNDLKQNDRTVVLNIASTSGDVRRRDANADGFYQQTMVVIIEDDDECRNPGVDTKVFICESEKGIINLFDQLNNQPEQGGTWTTTSGIDISDPANVDLSSVAQGEYAFEYSFPISSFCQQNSATLTLIIQDAFNPGNDITTGLLLCGDDRIDLNQFLSPDATPGGVFELFVPGLTRDNTFFPARDDFFDPSIVFTEKAQVYVVYYSPTGCNSGRDNGATIVLNIQKPYSPGRDNVITVCDNTTRVDLFASLKGNPADGGTWTGPAGVDLTNPSNIDLSGLTTGKYQFTYTTNGPNPPCIDDNSASVFINVGQSGSAGSDGSIVMIKPVAFDEIPYLTPARNKEEPASSVNLYNGLGGNPDQGGEWSFVSSTETLNPAIIAAMDFSDPNDFSFPEGAPTGTYKFSYTISGSGSCQAASSTLTIELRNGLSAGLSGSQSICEQGTTSVVNFIDIIGGTQFLGQLIDADNSGVNLQDPSSVNFDGIAEGFYTFQNVVSDPNGLALNDTSIVLVRVDLPAFPGFGENTTISQLTTVVNLNTLVDGNPDPGGTWEPVGIPYVPTQPFGLANFAGASTGDYSFAYKFAKEGVCPESSTEVNIAVVAAPKTGLNTTLRYCLGSAPDALDLYDALRGDKEIGGTWTSYDPSIAITGSTVDLSGKDPGIYIFSYMLERAGILASSLLSVTITNPATNPQPVDVQLCSSDPFLDLESQLGPTNPLGGPWTESTSSGVVLTNPHRVDFSGANPGTYTFNYQLNGQLLCDGSPAFATVNVTLNEAANAGKSATANACNNSAVNLFTTLQGNPEVGGTWTAEATNPEVIDLTNAPNVDFTGAAAGKYKFTYTVAGLGACANASSFVTVNVNQDHDPGIANTREVCNGQFSLVDLFANLGGTPDPGGNWTDTSGSGVNLSNPDSVSFAGIAAGDYDFTYTIAGDGVCNDVSAVVSVTVTDVPYAGIDNTVNVCSAGSSVIDLVDALGGSQDPGTWSETSDVSSSVNLADPTNVDFTGVPEGKYLFTYTVAGTGPCSAEIAVITVNVNQDADAGTPALLQICNEQGAILDLFGSLGGSPDPGGAWSEVSVISSGVTLTDPTNVVFENVTPGSYEFEYLIAGDGVCPSAVSSISVLVQKEINPGSNAAINVCNGNGLPINLYTSLGGAPDPGGRWVDVDNAGVVITGNFAGFSGIIPGSYRFQYVLDKPTVCTPKASVLTVEVGEVKSAGYNGILAVCDDSGNTSVRSLFDNLGGNPDTGGTWTDLDGSGVTLGDGTNVDFSTVPGGKYRYEYAITGGGSCGTQTAIITAIVNQNLVAGEDAQHTFCNFQATPLNLTSLLGGSPDVGGNWSFTGANSFPIPDPANVSINNVPADTYILEYAMAGEGTCLGDEAFLTLIIEEPLNSGNNGQTLALCPAENALADIAALFGNYANGGAFSISPAITGIDFSDPAAVDFSTADPGDYQITYEVSNNCGTYSSINAIFISEPGNAGTDAEVDVCSDDTTFNLFAALGGTPDTGGYWSDNNLSGVTLGDGTAVDFSGLKKGRYRYTYHVENNPCAPAIAVVTVNLEKEAFAGLDNTVTTCDAVGLEVNFTQAISINTSLTAEWTDDNSSGVDLSNPDLVDFSGVADGRYGFTHTAPGQNACGLRTAQLIVIVNGTPSTGVSANLDVCNDGTGAIADLQGALGSAEPGGSWSDNDLAAVDLFDPGSVDFTGVPAGTYTFTYTLGSDQSCNNTSSTDVTVTVSQSADAGFDNSVSFCDGTTAINLFGSLGGSPTSGGQWSEVTSSGVDLSDPANVDFSAVANGRYEFTYTVGTTTCGDVSSTLIVELGEAKYAGTDNAVTFCNDGSIHNLVDFLSSPVPGGTWTDQDNAGVDLSDPTRVFFTGVAGGNYRFVYTLPAENGCGAASATLSVTVSENPYAGIGAAAQHCTSDGAAVDLTALLTDNPDAGGSWFDLSNSGVDLTDPQAVDFTTVGSGVYEFNYIVSPTSTACNVSVATVTIEVSEQQNAGSPLVQTVELCNTPGTILNLATNLAPGYTPGGTWTINGEIVTDDTNFNVSELDAGYYEIDYSFAPLGPCGSSVARYYLQVNQGVNAGQPGSLAICDPNVPVNLFAAITGPYDQGGTWTDLNGTGVNLGDPSAVSFAGLDLGEYQFQYEVTDNGLCQGDHVNIVTIELVPQPNAGESVKIAINVGESPVINLFEALKGNPDTGGNWEADDPGLVDLSDPTAVDFTGVENGSYGFTYSVPATATCPESSSRVIVRVNLEAAFSDLNPSEGVSPNGDGINDFWFIRNIEAFPDNKVTLYNNLGSVVFEITGYNNSDRRFEGRANKNTLGNEELTMGTYYYVIEISGSQSLTGYLTLLK